MEDTLGEAESQSERPVIESGSTVAADTGGIAVIGDEEDSERSLTWEETANVLVDAAAVTESLGRMHYYSFAAVGVSEEIDPRLLALIPASGCGPGCQSACLNEFCINAPAEANRIFREGFRLKSRANDINNCGEFVKAASIRSTGVGAKSRRTMYTSVVLKTTPGDQEDGGSGGGGGGGEGQHTRKKRVDLLSTGLFKRIAAVLENAKLVLPKLMHPATQGGYDLCGFGARTVLSLTLHDCYGQGGSGLLVELGLRDRVNFGSRSERGLLPIEVLAHPVSRLDWCCANNCAGVMAETGLTKSWETFEAAKTISDQNYIAFEGSFFNRTLWRVSSWCDTHYKRYWGFGEDRISALRAVAFAANPHGNAGRVPVNCTSVEIQNLMRRELQKNTIEDPVRAVLNVTAAAELGGASTLARTIIASLPADKRPRALITIKRFIKKYMVDRGIKGLSSHRPGHNACTLCLSDAGTVSVATRCYVCSVHDHEDAETKLEQVRRDIARDSAAAEDGMGAVGGETPSPSVESCEKSLAEALAKMNEMRAALEEAQDVGEEHRGLHYSISDEVRDVQGLFQALAAQVALTKQAASDAAAASQPAASSSSSSSSSAAAATSSLLSPMEVRDENTGTAIVMDDKSALPLPRCHTESTDVFSKQTFGVNAQANLVTEGGAIYSTAAATPFKNSNIEINQTFLNLVLHNKGERVLFLLSDMGPLLYTAAISLLFAMFLLDLGYYDMVVVAYLQRYHSKQLCDRL